MEHLVKLSDRDMGEVANALRSGRLSAPFSSVAVQRLIAGNGEPALTEDLRRLADSGFTSEQIATTLEIVQSDRLQRPRVEDVLQLVTTGPEVEGIANRDTSVVVRDLFANATLSVFVAGYAVYQGQRVFQSLADRMVEIPTLQVRLFLDIQRGYGETTSAAELMGRFAQRFRQTQWPAERPLPKVYFDPRSLDVDLKQRTALHAKCVVIDDCNIFVSSANFTEAAQQRNIELGLLFRSAATASSITNYFDSMLRQQLLAPLF
jgi:phosphatidylserine/phosphatidylglycerophosphate/cardiolipin synthase-like enzyme